MAKDPKTGIVKPVTLFPKNIVQGPGGVTTIQVSHNPGGNIRLAGPSVSGTLPNRITLTSPLTQPSLPTTQPQSIITQPPQPITQSPKQNVNVPISKLPTPPKQPLPPTTIVNKGQKDLNVVGSQTLNLDEHGLICREGCNCVMMNGGHLGGKIKAKFWAYLKKCMKITSRDAEVFLSYEWIYENIFNQLLSVLARPTFFMLCRVVSFVSANGYAGKTKLYNYVKKIVDYLKVPKM